jgi:ketosteroid isomerase-like protein
MSQENVELVREAQDAWNRGETVVRADVWHPDVEFLPLRSATEGGYNGLSGIEPFVTDTLAVFEKFEMNYEYADLGDQVLAWGSIHLRARGSGVETDIQTGGLFDFRDGKIVRWEDFGSKERALEAARLRE